MINIMISKQQKQLIIMLTLFVITITGLLKFMTNLTIIKTIETRRGIVQIYSQITVRRSKLTIE